MTLKELETDVMNEITFSGALPFKLPIKELERIITNAKRYFYDYWRYGLEKTHIIIPLDVFKSPLYEKQHGIFLPECIQYVTACEECKGSSIFGSIDRDLGDQKFVGSELFLTPFMGEALVYRLAMFSFLDLTKNLTISTLSYDYNNGSHFLRILGRSPKVNVHLAVSKRVEDEYLYNLEIFQRYVRAKAKIRTQEMLSLLDFNLPGEFKYNYSEMANFAKEEMTKIEETIKGENVNDFIIMTNY